MLYRKLKNITVHGYASHIPNFTKVFPELKHLTSEELGNRWIELGVDLYSDKAKPVPKYIRLTLPFALILILIMFIGLPINFMITGNWGYDFNEKNRIYNWFKSLRLQ